MPKTQLKIPKFQSLDEFQQWWDSPEVFQFCQRHPDKIGRLRELQSVKPWIEQIEERIKKETQAEMQERDEIQTSGKVFGKYIVESKLGEGGMGAVYLATDPILNRKIALKIMLLKGKAAEERFLREARSSAKLKHPNIVQVHDTGKIEKYNYFTMDYIEGSSLENLIEEKQISQKRVIEIIRDIAFTLQYAHSEGIIHRDIKPSNIIIDNNGKPFLTDFGLAKEMDSREHSLTLSGTILGTPDYMSPEQAKGEKHKIDRKSDIFSLGATFYHALVGTTPFKGRELYQILESVVRNDPILPSHYIRNLSRDIETICLKCLEKEQKSRYQTSQALAEDLQRYLNGEAIKARPISLPEKIWRKSKRNKFASITIGSIVIIGIIVLIVLSVSSANKNQAIKQYKEDVYNLYKANRYKKALEKCDELLLLSPGDKDIKNLREECSDKTKEEEKTQLANKKKTEARTILKGTERRNLSTKDKLEIALKSLESDHEFIDAIQFVAGVYKELKDFNKAIEYYEKAIKLSPDFVAGYFYLGFINGIKLNNSREAAPYWKKTAELDPNGYFGYFAQGMISFYTPNFKESVEFFSKAIELNPDFREAYGMRGYIYTKSEEFEDAIADFNVMIKSIPDDFECYYQRGFVYLQKQEYDRAINDFTKTIDLNSKDALSYYHRGNAYLFKNELDKAIADFNKAIELNPEAISSYYGRGVAYDRRNEYDKAIIDMTKVINSDPDFVEAYHARAKNYAAKGQFDLAIADGERFLDIRPAHSLAKEVRFFIQEWKNRSKK